MSVRLRYISNKWSQFTWECREICWLMCSRLQPTNPSYTRWHSHLKCSKNFPKNITRPELCGKVLRNPKMIEANASRSFQRKWPHQSILLLTIYPLTILTRLKAIFFSSIATTSHRWGWARRGIDPLIEHGKEKAEQGPHEMGRHKFLSADQLPLGTTPTVQDLP